LNSSYLYDPASLAGRKIFMGWPYFAWSAGYDTNQRNLKMRNLFNPSDMHYLCNQLYKEKIDYIEIQNPAKLENISIKYDYFSNNFQEIFFDEENNITIYETKTSCKRYIII
jgi:hypothetical protein